MSTLASQRRAECAGKTDLELLHLDKECDSERTQLYRDLDAAETDEEADRISRAITDNYAKQRAIDDELLARLND